MAAVMALKSKPPVGLGIDVAVIIEALEVKDAIALGIKSPGLVTIDVPLITATGSGIEEMEAVITPVGTIVMLPLTIEAKIPPVGVIVTAESASGRADLSMAGRAEARALGKFETKSARAV